jgi:hypothetical protein
VYIPCGSYTGPITIPSNVALVSLASGEDTNVVGSFGLSPLPVQTCVTLLYSGSLTLVNVQNMRMSAISLDFANVGAGVILTSSSFNQFSYVTIKHCGNPSTPCLTLDTNSVGAQNNSVYNTFDHLRIQCNQNSNATGIKLAGSGTVNAGAAVTENRFSDVIITGAVKYGIQQELNSDTNYFTNVSVNEDVGCPGVSGSAVIAINTLNPTIDQDADGEVYNGINATGCFASSIAAGSTIGSNFIFSFGAPPTITSLGGTQSWTIQGVGLPGVPSSSTVPVLTVTRGISSSGPGFQHKRIGGCTTAVGVGWACNVSLTWAKPFADTNYTTSCSVATNTSYFGYAMPTTKTTTSLLINIVNGTPGQAFTANEIDCIAVHD